MPINCEQLIENLSDEKIEWFASINGAMQVWKSWRDTMLEQGREIAPERIEWEHLLPRDRDLDAQIAFDVIIDFVNWALSHPHE